MLVISCTLCHSQGKRFANIFSIKVFKNEKFCKLFFSMFTGIFSRTQNQLHGHLTEIYLKLVCIYVDMVTSFKASIPRMAMKIQVDPQVTK